MNTEENLYILATAYYRSGKHNVAYSILSRNKYNPLKSPNCHFLRAKCCFQLGKIEEAANLLIEPINYDPLSDKIFPKEDLIRVYGENASFVAQLLGQLFNKLEDQKAAAHYYTLSLKLNPFLWYSYEKLLQIDPSKVDQDKLFNVDNLDLKFSCGTNPLINLFNSSQMNMIPSSDDNVSTRTTTTNNDHTKTPNEDTSHYFVTPEVRKTSTNNSKNRIELSTPYAILKQSPSTNKVDVITPETDGQWKMMTCLAPTKNNTRNGRKFNTQNHTIPSSQVLIETSNIGSNRNLNSQTDSSGHLFGVLCLDQESVNVMNRNNNVTNSKVDNKHVCLGRKESIQQDSQMIIDNEQSLVNPVTTNNSPSILTRRSSRLINSDTRSIKENSSSVKKIVVDRRVTPVKRCRRTISFEKSKNIVKQNNNENDSTIQGSSIILFIGNYCLTFLFHFKVFHSM